MSRVLGVLAFELAHAEFHAVRSGAASFDLVATECLAGGGKFEVELLDAGRQTGIVHEEGVMAMMTRWSENDEAAAKNSTRNALGKKDVHSSTNEGRADETELDSTGCGGLTEAGGGENEGS